MPELEPGESASIEEVDLEHFFADVGGPGTFVLLEMPVGTRRVYNPERARTRFLPASTFKIPNTLIALETGVASGPDFTLTRDTLRSPAQDWWPRAWRQDQTLRSAFQNSVVWYYQELARRVGVERMQAYVDQFGYGNEDLSPAVDQFWLDGGLRISPEEQVDFVRRFYYEELGVSPRTTAIVKDIMVLEETASYRLGGKTGTAEVTPTRELAWLVGYLEQGDAVYFYALNMEGERIWEEWPPQQRVNLVRSMLHELEVIPEL